VFRRRLFSSEKRWEFSLKTTITDGTHRLPARSLVTRERIALYSGAILLLQLLAIGAWIVSYRLLHIREIPPPGIDFRVFWSASYVTLHSGAHAAFDQHALYAAESMLLDGSGLQALYLPWVYPPTFQLFISPLALFPYLGAYALFCCVGIALCLLACAPFMKSKPMPWIALVAFPGIWVTTLHGQNSLMTLAFAAGALGLLRSKPMLAGVCAGLLVVKPQLALVFPLLFLCGRHFVALAAAVVTATLLGATSLFAFGAPLWSEFLHASSAFNAAILESNGGGIWRALPTVFALLRSLGASLTVAYAIHGVVALSGLFATALLWVRQPLSRLGCAAAVVVALMIPPYLGYYEHSWLILPILFLCNDVLKRGGQSAYVYVAVVFAWLAPLASYLIVVLTHASAWCALVPPLMLLVILRRSGMMRRSDGSFHTNTPEIQSRSEPYRGLTGASEAG
jgi:hypothetical protein